MNNYQKPDKDIWSGRSSEQQLYLHEKINCIDLKNEILPKKVKNSFAILGYACDTGVKRNNGRIGAKKGPENIRKMLAPLSNHFNSTTQIVDVGNIVCHDDHLEKTQLETSEYISYLIENTYFPIVLGGGHDLAYAHYNGLSKQYTDKTIGIINLDAHFDLRQLTGKGNSGTPFYQIAKENDSFYYCCLGIQKASNNKILFETAKNLKVTYLENTQFNIENRDIVFSTLDQFISSVDHIYLTIDLDGFSSAYAPGVSAPSPLGFSLDIVLETLEFICNSNKLISLDLVELNPIYDIDNVTARLAARLIYSIIEKITS